MRKGINVLLLMKVMALATLALVTVRCGVKANLNLGGAKGASSGTSATISQQLKEQVDASCKGNAPRNSTPLGVWTVHRTSPNYTEDLTLTIEDKSVTLTNVCNLKGVTRTATATADSFLNGNQITITEAQDRTAGDRDLTCYASLLRGTSPIVFRGNCLVTNVDGHVHIFTHVQM